MLVTQAGEPVFNQKGFVPWAGQYPRYLRFNWPYDFVSIVESIRLDVDIKFNRHETTPGLQSNTNANIGKQNQTLSKAQRAKKKVVLKKKQ
jgi:hypothetical protein